jgi:cytochrome c biogenesis protein CcdA
MDTSLAILRRKLAGVSMSQADANHIHHLAKRALGGVKSAVVALYGVTLLFGVFGVVLGILAIEEVVRLRIIYAAAIVAFGGIGAVALKSALRNRWMAQTKPAEEPTAAGQAPTGGDSGAGAVQPEKEPPRLIAAANSAHERVD